MSLFHATLATGLLLTVLGAALLWNGTIVERIAKASLRSTLTTVLFFGGGALWFLWYVYHLSAADFGDYKPLLIALFGGVTAASFFVARDFLAVRGLSILTLLTAAILLDATPPGMSDGRRTLNVAVYLAIILALYLGALPYQLRDFFNWIWTPEKSLRPRALGVLMGAYGLLLIFVAANY